MDIRRQCPYPIETWVEQEHFDQHMRIMLGAGYRLITAITVYFDCAQFGQVHCVFGPEVK